jgi:TatA/E family protein of Tat protein translocase
MILREYWPVILIFVLVFFGAKRMPDTARNLGRSLRIFKSEMKEMKSDDVKDGDEGKDQNTPEK